MTNNLTNYEREALADPLAARAEKESATMPQSVTMPRGFEWNAAVNKEAARVEAIFEKWATANTALVEALDDYRAAIDADEIELKKAARAGTAHPGHKATAKAREALEWALTVCVVAREEVTKETQTGTLQKLMAQSVSECIDQAEALLDRTEQDTAAVIAITRQRFAEINDQRATVAEMCRWIAQVREVRVDSTYTERLPEPRLPDGFQARMTWAAQVLEHVDNAPRKSS